MKKMVLHYMKRVNALLVLHIFIAHDECTKEKEAESAGKEDCECR